MVRLHTIAGYYKLSGRWQFKTDHDIHYSGRCPLLTSLECKIDFSLHVCCPLNNTALLLPQVKVNFKYARKKITEQLNRVVFAISLRKKYKLFTFSCSKM